MNGEVHTPESEPQYITTMRMCISSRSPGHCAQSSERPHYHNDYVTGLVRTLHRGIPVSRDRSPASYVRTWSLSGDYSPP